MCNTKAICLCSRKYADVVVFKYSRVILCQFMCKYIMLFRYFLLSSFYKVHIAPAQSSYALDLSFIRYALRIEVEII